MRYFAVGKYYKKLLPELRQRYGTKEAYTAGQIKRSVIEGRFSKRYLAYAYGLLLTVEELKTTLSSEYPNEDVGAIRKYLAGRFFGGDENFSHKEFRFSGFVGVGNGADSGNSTSFD